MFNREDKIYDILKKKVGELEANGVTTFKTIVNIISNDNDVDWHAIRMHEIDNNAEWDSIKASWKYKIIQALVTPGKYTHGGDRTSAAARGAKQRVLLEYTRALALQRPLDEDDEVVADEVVDAVGARYRGTTDGQGLVEAPDPCHRSNRAHATGRAACDTSGAHPPARRTGGLS